MIKYVGQVVREVLLGIGLWGIVGTAVILAAWGLSDGILYGFLLGVLLSVGYFIHMSITLETSMDMMEEKSAKNHALRSYLIRVAVGAVALTLACLALRLVQHAGDPCGLFHPEAGGVRKAAYSQGFLSFWNCKRFRRLKDKMRRLLCGRSKKPISIKKGGRA